jgi:hypothetical protein
MRTVGFDRPLYILPFDHRGSFQTNMFGCTGELTAEQTAQIAAAKRVIYDGLLAALAAGVPRANDWAVDQHPMTRLGNGDFALELELPAGKARNTHSAS